jgi:hypothetical protein
MTRDIEDDPVDDGLLDQEAFWISEIPPYICADTYSYLSFVAFSYYPTVTCSAYRFHFDESRCLHEIQSIATDKVTLFLWVQPQHSTAAIMFTITRTKDVYVQTTRIQGEINAKYIHERVM